MTGAPVRSASAARQRRRRRGGTLEEVDVHGVGAEHVLIDQDRHAVAVRQRSDDAADGAAPVDDRIARASADPLQLGVQVGIVQRTPDDADWFELEGVDDRMLLPEPEMPGEEQHTPPLSVGEADAVLAVEVDERHHPVLAQRAEPQQLQQHAAEVGEGGARDGAALGGRPHGKGFRQIVERDAAMDAIEEVEGEAEQPAED
jgi:hypothetical protein